MEKRNERIPVMGITAAGAVVVYLLRHIQMQTQLDETGRIMAGAGRGPLTWICLGLTLLIGAYAFLLGTKDTVKNVSMPAMVATLAAAFFLVLGSFVSFKKDLLMALCGIGTAVCWVIIALRRQQDKTPSAILFMLPALFGALQLIVRFRDWSRDPLLMDYCFELLASICVLCATFHLGGFSLGRCRRRTCMFFCMSGVLFCAVAMAGRGILSVLSSLGSGVWLLANLWLILDEETL